MMALGDFVFGIIGGQVAPDQMDRSQAWSWPEQERVGKMGVLQYTGKDPDDLKIPGVIYPGQVGKYRSLDVLRVMADAGIPYLLVDIEGWVRGKWVITALSEKRSHLILNGAPLKIEFDLGLKRYAE